MLLQDASNRARAGGGREEGPGSARARREQRAEPGDRAGRGADHGAGRELGEGRRGPASDAQERLALFETPKQNFALPKAPQYTPQTPKSTSDPF